MTSENPRRLSYSEKVWELFYRFYEIFWHKIYFTKLDRNYIRDIVMYNLNSTMLSDITKQDIDFLFHSESISGFRKSEIEGGYISIAIPVNHLFIEKEYLHIEDDIYVVNFGEPKFRSKLERKLNILKERKIIAQYFLNTKQVSEMILEEKQYYVDKYGSDADSVMAICNIDSIELTFIPEKIGIFERIYKGTHKLVCKESLVGIILEYIGEVLMVEGFNMDTFFEGINIEEKYTFYDLNLTIRALLESNEFNVVKIYRFLKYYLGDEKTLQFEKDIRHNGLPSLNLQVIEIDKDCYFTGTSLRKGDKEESLGAFQIKLCEYFFNVEPFRTEGNSEELQVLLYGEGGDADLKSKNIKEVYEEVNKKAKRIGVAKQLFGKIDNKILLKMKK